MKVTILAAGAAGMYCGSCIRDNALALALRRMGHDAVMVPLYTPVKTDAENASIGKVFYGGVNVWLQSASRIFRHTPRFLDWLFDRPKFLMWAGSKGAQTSPAQLGQLTLDIIRGEDGPTKKELKRLADFLKSELKPDVITLPNLMFIGAAKYLREHTGAAVIAECTGEDIFLDAMAEPWKSQATALIRERAAHVSRFVATSQYYAGQMAAYLNVPADRIDVVYPGVPEKDLATGEHFVTGGSSDGRAIGFLARICPEKGLDRLIDAAVLLKQRPDFATLRVRAAGYLGKANEPYFEQLKQRVASSPLGTDFMYFGEVDRARKIELFDSVDLACTPTAYPEPKGLYVLEALARGCPVVLAHHGSAPELIEATGGGITVPPGDAPALADALAALFDSPDRRAEMSRAGLAAVREKFLDTHMARGMLQTFERARG